MSKASSMNIHRVSRLMVSKHRSPTIKAASKRPARLLPSPLAVSYIPKSPMHPFDMVRLAVNKDAKNDTAGALKWLGKAIDRDPNFLMAYAIRAVIFMRTKEYDLSFRDIIAVRMLNRGLDISRPSIADRLALVRIPPRMRADV